MMLEDFSAFLSDFAVVCTLSNGVSIRGVFDNGAAGVSIRGVFDNGAANSLNIIGSDPKLVCQSADVSTLTFGSTLSIQGVTYTVRQIMPDGFGITTLMLEG